MSKTKLGNDTFWTNFNQKSKAKYPTLSATIANINDMIEDIIQDYKVNKKSERSYLLITQVQQEIDELFENLKTKTYGDVEIEALTKMCRKVNEDMILTEIRDLVVTERLQTEPLGKKQGDSLYELEDHSFSLTEPTSVNDSQEEIERQEIAAGTRLLDVEEFQSNPGTRIFDSRTTNLDENLELEKQKEINRIEALFTKMRQEYEEHRIDEAYDLLVQVKALDTTNREFLKSKLQENKQLIEDIEMFNSFCDVVLNEMNDEQGYQLEKDSKKLTISYKCAEGESIGLKIEGEVDVPLFNMLALVNEPEGYPKWFPFLSQAVLNNQITRNAKTFWAKCSLPPPIFGREMHLVGAGFNRLNVNGSILLTARTIQDDKKFQERFNLDIPEKSKITRMQLDYLGMELAPLSKDKTHMKLVVKFDPKVKYLPMSLANWLVRKMAQHLIESMVKKASNLKGTIWEKRISEDRVFYGWLEQIVGDFLAAAKVRSS